MRIPSRTAIIALIFAGGLLSDLSVRIRAGDMRLERGNFVERVLAAAETVEIEVTIVRPVAASVHEYD